MLKNFKIAFALISLLLSGCAVSVPVDIKMKKEYGAIYSTTYKTKKRPSALTYSMIGIGSGLGAYQYVKSNSIGKSLGISMPIIGLATIGYLIAPKNEPSLYDVTRKYNKLHESNFTYGYNCVPFNSRSKNSHIVYRQKLGGNEYTAGDRVMLFNIDEIQTHKLRSKQELLDFAYNFKGKKSVGNAMLNSDPCLIGDFDYKNIIREFEISEETISFNTIKCSQNTEIIIGFFKTYPNSIHIKEVEDLFIKGNVLTDPNRFSVNYYHINQFATTRPTFYKRIESELSNHLQKNLYTINYSGDLYDFINQYPNNQNSVSFKKRAEELKKKEDAEEVAKAEKRRREREWRNNSSSSSDYSSSSSSANNNKKSEVDYENIEHPGVDKVDDWEEQNTLYDGRHYVTEVTFEDGITGFLYKGGSSGDHFIENSGGANYYYKNYDAALRALYIYKKYGEIIKRGAK